MDYIELTVSTTTFGAETVSEILMENGAAGTQIIDRNDLPDPDHPGKNWELMDRRTSRSRPGWKLRRRSPSWRRSARGWRG